MNSNHTYAGNFDYLKKVIRNDVLRNRAHRLNKNYIPEIPPEVSVQLTTRCNLRCKSCMQWSNSGFIKHNTKAEIGDLDLDIFQKVLNETGKEKSCLHLWGGEPLLHNDWETISALLEKDKRKIVLSTNGILIEEKAESLLKIDNDMHIVVSLDGNREANDMIRGRGTYEEVIGNLNLLIKLKRNNVFTGEIIINTVLNEWLIPSLSEYIMQINDLKIDKLILSYPWYITESGRNFMDNYFSENYSLLTDIKENPKPSWHSFQFSIPDNTMHVLKEQLNRIPKDDLKVKLRLQPNVEPEEALQMIHCNYPETFIRDSYCLGTCNRMSICANGNVNGCPDFPEFIMGSLYDNSLRDIWNCENYNKLRDIRNHGAWPLPICFKCSLFSKNRI